MAGTSRPHGCVIGAYPLPRMYLRHVPLALFVLASVQASAQGSYCGADVLRDRSFTPELVLEEDALYRSLAAHDRSGERDVLLVIPVVFHVIHQNGPENVPDSVIQLAVEQMNTRLQNMAPYDDVTGHVSDIQLCLAAVDPFGNPTNGITRHESPWTVNSIYDQVQVKSIERWDPLRYLNVWLVSSVTEENIDGYSSFPVNKGSAVDGIVIEAQYLLNNSLPVHELGHYLGLFHTFQGYCTNYNCQFDGDRICDTPPDDSNWFTCGVLSCPTETMDTTGLSPFTGDVPELPNYMDYSSCPLSFSQDQVDRMRDVLTVVRTELLASYGCGAVPFGPPAVAACVVDSSECTGRVTFTSTSVDAEVVQWDVDGSGWTTVDTALVFDFTGTGPHTVTMFASGPGGTDSVQIVMQVRVPPSPQYPILSGFEGIFPDVYTGAPMLCYGSAVELIGDPLMVAYQWSTGANTADLNVLADSSFSIRLTAVDSNGLEWTNCAWIEAGVLPPAVLTASTNDTVYCNQLVHLELVPTVNAQWYIGGGMIMGHPITYYYDYLSTNFFPMPFWAGYNDQNGCALHTDTFNLVTLPTIPPVISQLGDDLVLDHGCANLQWYSYGKPLPQYFMQMTIPDAPPGCYWIFCHECNVPVYSDTLCVLPTNVPSISDGNGYRVYPSPVTDRLWITPAPAVAGNVTIIDASGRCVMRATVGTRSEGIDVKTLSSGVYLLRARLDGVERTMRFIKE